MSKSLGASEGSRVYVIKLYYAMGGICFIPIREEKVAVVVVVVVLS